MTKSKLTVKLCAFALGSSFMSVMTASAAHIGHHETMAETPEAKAARAYLDVEFAPEVEARLALSGGPAHLRDGASVYVYKKGTGFVLHHQGDNGFICLVNRDSFFYKKGAFKPTCWDEAGSDTYVPVMLAVGGWLAEGKTAPEVKAMVNAGFENGTFKSPETTGVAYMVAGDLDLDRETGKVLKNFFPGHHMYYAPNVTTKQFAGANADRKKDPTLPRIFAGGAGGTRLGYLISMIGHVQSN